MKHKIIVIEGTDCSGKKTQSDLLYQAFQKDGTEITEFHFPMYETPTGKIIGGPFLGKEQIGNSWFQEGASQVDYRVAVLYYAADRMYNIHKIEDAIKKGHVILDRYVYSNMAHQGGKILDNTERFACFQFIDSLEFGFLKLPKPDICVFLHVPYQKTLELLKNRIEAMDEVERDEEYLKNAELAYLELARVYHWKIVECVNEKGEMRSIEDIHEEVYEYVKRTCKGLL